MADIAAKEFALWIQPRDAIRQAARRFGDAGNAAVALFGRLKDGILVAAAERAVSHGVKSAFKVIPPDHWKALEKIPRESSLWQSGDILIEARSGYSVVSIGYQGIRFDPEQVDKLIGTPAAGTLSAGPAPEEPVAVEPIPAAPAATEPIIVVEAVAATVPASAKPEKANKIKHLRVPQAHLKAWYAAYKAVYGGTPADTPSFALQSAQGMFPDKAVSPGQLRQIAGARKRALNGGAQRRSRKSATRRARKRQRRR